MAAGLVVGIFANSDAKALEGALSQQPLDLSKIKVVGGRADHGTQLEFIDVMDDMESNSLSDEMTEGTGVWDETGTDVPGLTAGHQATLEQFTHYDEPHRRYFASFAIPDDEVDNFCDAVADGRSVVLYPDPGADEQQIATAFRAAGLKNVRAY